MSKQIAIAVCNEVWSVSRVPTNSPKLYVDGHFCRGTTWIGHREIAIAEEVSEEAALRVIRHELAHAYLASTQIRQIDEFNEEDLCEFVAIYSEALIMQARQVVQRLYKPAPSKAYTAAAPKTEA